MKKADEMKNKLEQLKTETQGLLDKSQLQEAEAKMAEIKEAKALLAIQEQLDLEELAALQMEAQTADKGTNEIVNRKNASMIRALLKKAGGSGLSEAENALLLPSTDVPLGGNGESYILPQDIQTQINKKIREYRSLRDVIGYLPTGALTGSFPVEDFETVQELIDFTDGTNGTEANDIKFKNIKFSLVEKGALLKLSNTLISLTDNALLSYVQEIFAKKAVKTENKMAIVKLKENKTVKALADWKALKSSINIDLDPAVLYGTAIVTNQDGFDYLDKALDNNGRPILQPDSENPTGRRFAGYPVTVYSNSMLETSPATKTLMARAPIFYGNLKEAVKFVDLNGKISFATSFEAGFTSNTTYARLIEFIDVVQCDSSDKCYVYGELEVRDVLP